MSGAESLYACADHNDVIISFCGHHDEDERRVSKTGQNVYQLSNRKAAEKRRAIFELKETVHLSPAATKGFIYTLSSAFRALHTLEAVDILAVAWYRIKEIVYRKENSATSKFQVAAA